MTARRKQRNKTPKKRSEKKSYRRRTLGTPGEWFGKLVAVQARLRAPRGCPWDREQTHQTLRTYLLEEAYEVLEALDNGNDAKFAEELGDLLLQILFHSQIAQEDGRFAVTDVIRAIHDKLIRRHPHVFGDSRAKDAAEVLRNWELIKAEERRSDKSSRRDGDERADAPSLLDGVSRALPATLAGFQLTRRAARVGFDWDNVRGVIAKIREETAEFEAALKDKSGNENRIEEEIGDLLFAAINLSRFLQVDPEIALKKANAKFSRRFRAMEAAARGTGREFKDLPREEMETLWDAMKSAEEKSRANETGEAQARR